MNDLQRLAPDTLRIERVLAAPIDTVWRWLVDPELRQLWFAGGTAIEGPGELELEFDHDRLGTRPSPYPPEYGEHRGARCKERVLRCEPPRVLAFTWGGGTEGVATFELEPQGNRTRLVLTHRGISGPAPYRNFAGGWAAHLEVLQARVAGGSVEDFWALFRRAEAEVDARPG
jgi:uncharacterized protein YndB with AHSA1/START domain